MPDDCRGGPDGKDKWGGRLSLSCPTVVIGHPASFLLPRHPGRLVMPSLEGGFPLKTGGKDRGETAGRTGAASLAVMPDGCNRASSIFSLLRHPIRLVMPAPPGFP